MIQVEEVSNGRIAAAQRIAELLGVGFTSREYASCKGCDSGRIPKGVKQNGTGRLRRLRSAYGLTPSAQPINLNNLPHFVWYKERGIAIIY